MQPGAPVAPVQVVPSLSDTLLPSESHRLLDASRLPEQARDAVLDPPLFLAGSWRVNYVPKRWWFVLLCFLAVTLNYSDRTNISVAIMNMADEFHWSETKKGFVLSAFYFGYFFSGVPGGYIADRFGGKRVLAFAASVWSLFTVLTPLAAHTSYGALLAARVLLGMAEVCACELRAMHAR